MAHNDDYRSAAFLCRFVLFFCNVLLISENSKSVFFGYVLKVTLCFFKIMALRDLTCHMSCSTLELKEPLLIMSNHQFSDEVQFFA